MIKKRVAGFLSLVFVTFLTACSTLTTEKLTCPVTGFISETDYITKKQAGTGDILYRAYFDRVFGFCNRDGEDLEIEVVVNIKGGYHPDQAASVKKDIKIPYFVTILDDQSNLLIKHNFTAMVQMNTEGYGQAQMRQDLRIPMANLGQVDQAQILVGMQLTPEELQTNREEGRF